MILRNFGFNIPQYPYIGRLGGAGNKLGSRLGYIPQSSRAMGAVTCVRPLVHWAEMLDRVGLQVTDVGIRDISGKIYRS